MSEMDPYLKSILISFAYILLVFFAFYVFMYFRFKASLKKYPPGTGKFTSVVIGKVPKLSEDTKASEILNTAEITGCKHYRILGIYNVLAGDSVLEYTRYKIEYWE